MTYCANEERFCAQTVPAGSDRFCTNEATHRVIAMPYGLDLGWVCDEHWQALIDAGLVKTEGGPATESDEP